MAYLTWDAPETGEDVAKVEIHRCATETGSYTLVDTIDAVDGNGAWVTAYDDSGAASTSWYKIRFLNTALQAGAYSTARQIAYDILTYTTVALVKSLVPSVTVTTTDAQVRKAILDAESYIDSKFRREFKTGYDPTTKHGFIRTLCTKQAVVNCLEPDIITSLGRDRGSILIDAFRSDIENDLLRVDKQGANYLASL